MFSSFRLRNFKSHKDSTLPLAPLTLMIGTNASGKTNALEGIRFLSWMARGIRLEDIYEDVQALEITIRGSLRDLAYHHAETFSLGCTFDTDEMGEWRRFDVTLQVNDNGLTIKQESISGGSTVPLYKIAKQASKYSNEVQVAYNNFARGGRKPQIPCSNQRPIFTQLDTPSRFKQEKSQELIPQITERLRASLEDRIVFLDPNFTQMRGYSYTSKKPLHDDGSNLSGVLYDLCERQGQKEQVLDFVRHLPEQSIQDIRFAHTERDEVMVRLVESFGGAAHEWEAPMLSNGTLRTLAVAAAVLSAPEGSLIAIEEIDNGVHPSRAGTLLQRIQSIAEERSLRVLLTSHNPALLDSLPTEAVPHVVCCYRDPEDGYSRLIRLHEIDQYPELVARGPLGRLMTQGIIEKYVKQRTTEAEREEQDAAWLNDLTSDLDLQEEIQ